MPISSLFPFIGHTIYVAFSRILFWLLIEGDY